jgi:hypothetical protein
MGEKSQANAIILLYLPRPPFPRLYPPLPVNPTPLTAFPNSSPDCLIHQPPAAPYTS